LFLCRLFELVDEFDDVIVLVLPSGVGGKVDGFKLFDGVGFVFALRAPNCVARGRGRVKMLTMLRWFLNRTQLYR
jgi:hypothetical protein